MAETITPGMILCTVARHAHGDKKQQLGVLACFDKADQAAVES